MSDTPKAIFEDKIAPRLAGKPEIAAQVNASYQFDITGTDGGTWHIDLTKPAAVVGSGPIENPGCIVAMADKDFVDLVSGKLNGQMAFMTGKLKIKGNMGLAMKLQKVLAG